MIVYRCISEQEIANLMGIINEPCIGPHGENTFNYENNIRYKHFYYFYDSAISFMNAENIERYYNDYELILAYNIDDEVLKKHFGFGTYNIRCLPYRLQEKFLTFFDKLYFPEFAIPENEITKDMIVGIGDRIRITPITTTYDNMCSSIKKSKEGFINYQKWLINNGTNVKLDKIKQVADELFPIKNNNKVKIYKS